MLTFEGKIQGVQLCESSLVRSTVRLSGHLNDVACAITIETNRETAKLIESQYGVDSQPVPLQLGNGGEL